MLSYYSTEATAKEDKTNFKSDETVVLVGEKPSGQFLGLIVMSH
jgi:hypothetical protein